MNLSKYITVEQASFSATAIRNNIDNTIVDQEHLDSANLLCKMIYDPLCEHFGFRIPFTSFYRSSALNKKIRGSSPKSQHSFGQAIDLCPKGTSGLTNAELFEYIRKNLPFDQLIWEGGTDEDPAWVHVSYKTQQRGSVLRATFTSQRTIYTIL